MKEEFELFENDWLDAQYSTRHMWADSFLRGHYFGRSRATGRCESMNAFLKRDLEEDVPLWMFMRHCDNGLTNLRYNEMSEDYKTNMTEPLLNQTNMPMMEEQAASIFTREMFNQVKAEIKRADKYIILERSELNDYDVCMVSRYMRKDPKRKVFCSHDGGDVRCDCYSFETKGIPCRHIFSAMKHLNMSDFPPCLVKERWLKDAKIIDPSSIGLEKKCPHPDDIENSRYSGITTQCNLVAFYATRSREAFGLAMQVMAKLVGDLQELPKETRNNRSTNGLPFDIKNPRIVPTKGRPSRSQKASDSMPFPLNGKRKGTSDKPRCCKLCGGTGHDSRNCPTNEGSGKRSKKD